MDVMVLPTWREGFPNVVLEAAATGIPVVTTQSTGSRDSVVPEVTGLLIPPGYPEAISEAVLKLLRVTQQLEHGLTDRLRIARWNQQPCHLGHNGVAGTRGLRGHNRNPRCRGL